MSEERTGPRQALGNPVSNGRTKGLNPRAWKRDHGGSSPAPQARATEGGPPLSTLPRGPEAQGPGQGRDAGPRLHSSRTPTDDGTGVPAS